MKQEAKSTVRIGELSFELQGDPQLIEQLTLAFSDRTQADAYELIDLDRICDETDFELAVEVLLNQAYGKHRDYLFLDAALLAGADGRLVMLAGASLAGKTTLSVAAGLSGIARIISEDTVFVKEKRFTSVIAPLSIRPPTVPLLAQLGYEPQPYKGRFFLLPEIFAGCGQPTTNLTDIVILEAAGDNKLSVADLSAAEAMVQLLPISNALVDDRHYQELLCLVEGSKSTILAGGGLRDRLEFVKTLFNWPEPGSTTVPVRSA